ncbi:probable serine/threonine-protein kinase pats1 [Mytilus edulis]|uniref:probable serine/threonine-protein kinase pats1 n=1 Tax=Mytilus edulis TaxID=6550 RepID=UPI0039EFA1E7
MSKHDREEFLKATKSGTTQRYYIRVMIVGKNSAGKTCLLRRLMNKPIDDVISTDGLDIEKRKCQVDVKTGEWYFPTTHIDTYSVWSGKSEQFADCGFWDFAGQKDFYATHQTFLSTNAVYLLVTDVSIDFSNQTYHKMLEDKFDSVGGYIDFWLDNVHCYRTDVHNASNQCSVDLNPPVVIVGTGIDKIPLDKRKDRQQNFQNHLRKILSVQEKRRHLRKTHFLSNTCPSDNREEFKQLRKEIFDTAKALKNWGDNLPSRWIVLEKVIHSKISGANYTMSYAEAIELATKCSFPDLENTTSELDSFLKYEHDIGNIIFFEDVKEFIVLDPQWLVDVFKCFVTNKYANDLIMMTEWSDLENKGKLLDKLVEKLLEKVPHLSLMKHKQFVLQIMEKFDIIVKPRNDQESKILYMPCMIKPATLRDIFMEIGAKNCKRKTSWFMLEFDFLPPSYFNHVLVSFVKEKKLSTKKNNQLCIYRNIGLFDINETGTEVLMICLSQNAIAMQVLQWNSERRCYSDLKNKLIDLVRLMKLRYRIDITYTKQFKCYDGNCFNNDGRVDSSTLLAGSEYRCKEHKNTHHSKDILESWLTVCLPYFLYYK